MIRRPCKGCGKEIALVLNVETKQWIPLDLSAPVYMVIDGGAGVAERAVRTPNHFVSHFCTCPKAADFSRKKGG